MTRPAKYKEPRTSYISGTTFKSLFVKMMREADQKKITRSELLHLIIEERYSKKHD